MNRLADIVRMQPALEGALGIPVPFPVGNLGRATNVFSGGLPLHAPSTVDAHGTVPFVGARRSVVRPASPPGGAGQGMGHPKIGIAYLPQTAPAAALEPAPLEPGVSPWTVLGIVTAIAAAGYVAFR